MKARLRSTVAAAMLLGPLAASLVAQPAAAATQRAPVQASITSLSIDSDDGLAPGATLRLQMSATPNARRASVTLGDSGVTVPLRQQSRGTYTGTHVVRRSEHIDPTQRMTARVTFGSRTFSREFNYPPGFQALDTGATAPAAGGAIERFVMHPEGRLEPGRELRFSLRGAPGGDAWVDIPGVIRGIDLTETRPGVYEGSYTIRRHDNLDAFRNAVATLRRGDDRATARVDVDGRGDRGRDMGRDQRRDEQPPQITDLVPANGEHVTDRGRTLVGVHLSDVGAGIDPASVRLRLNGRDVTADARITADEVRYRADLDPGRYTAEVAVRDNAGNSTTKAWTFDVGPGDRAGPARPVEMPLHITSHANNAAIDAEGNFTLQGRTLPFANVRVQVESVANVAGVLGVTQPVADVTVQADRDGQFSVAIPRRGLPIPGTRYNVHVTASSGSQTAEERLTLVQRSG